MTLFRPDPSRRIRRELGTVRVMMGMYCSDHHEDAAEACARCGELWDYVRQRIARCPFGADKPTCLQCRVHCYKPSRREEIRAVMRYAGPRMTLRHPILALLHVLDGKREHPALPPSRISG